MRSGTSFDCLSLPASPRKRQLGLNIYSALKNARRRMRIFGVLLWTPLWTLASDAKIKDSLYPSWPEISLPTCHSQVPRPWCPSRLRMVSRSQRVLFHVTPPWKRWRLTGISRLNPSDVVE